MLFCYFEAFSEKFTENFSFNPKIDYIRKEHRNTQKVNFFNKFEKGKTSEGNLNLFKQMFVSKSVK